MKTYDVQIFQDRGKITRYESVGIGRPLRPIKLSELFRAFYDDVLSQKSYYLPVAFMAIVSYAFSLTNRTLSVDDLARDIYNGSGKGMISGLRWGMDLWMDLFSTGTLSPFIDRFMAVCFWVLSGVLLSCLLYYMSSRDRYVWQYTAASSALVTFPLIGELFEYNGVNMIAAANVALATLSVLVYFTQLKKSGTINKNAMITSALLMTPVCSSYESGIFVYIMLVLAALLIKELYHWRKHKAVGGKVLYDWMVDGLGCALALAIALVLRIAVGFLVILITGAKYSPNGATGMYWEGGGLSALINNIGKNVFYYLVNGLVYLPIAVFVIAAVAFVIYIAVFSVKNKRPLAAVLGFFLLLSMFMQSFIQGVHLPYRTAQTVQVFVSLVVFFAVFLLRDVKLKKHDARRIMAVLLMFLCFRQAVCLNSILALNNQRSENEAAIVRQIGSRITEQYDPQKPIVVVGAAQDSGYIVEQVSVDENSLGGRLWCSVYRLLGVEDEIASHRKYVSTNVNSQLNWSVTAFESQDIIISYFSYCGYEFDSYTKLSGQPIGYFIETAQSEGMKPMEIRDMGEYTLIYLGDYQPEYAF